MGTRIYFCLLGYLLGNIFGKINFLNFFSRGLDFPVGKEGNCLELIKSYLSSCKQIKKFDDVMSDVKRIVVGVPQGSVQGPLLFFI